MSTSLRLDPDTENRLERLARSTGRTKTWFIRRAIEEYLDEWEDYHIALSRLEQEKDEVDITDVRRRLAATNVTFAAGATSKLRGGSVMTARDDSAATRTQREKALRFHALHQRDGTFVMPNPWDRGSARLLEWLGFEALGTSSAGCAFSTGRADAARAVPRDEMLAHVAQLVAATSLPVSADLESGYADDPDGVAETMRLAVLETGVAGVSIEDSTYSADAPLYDIEEAAERVRAACEAVQATGVPAVVTARAECFLVGHPDPLAESIRRLNRYAEAGADVLYAPGLATAGEVDTLVRNVDRPVNVVIGMRGMSLPVPELSALGVRRVSLGSTLARVAVGAFLDASREIREHGTFTFLDRAAPYAELNTRFADQ